MILKTLSFPKKLQRTSYRKKVSLRTSFKVLSKKCIQIEKNKILLENLENIGFEFTSQNVLTEGRLNSLNICVTGELEDFSRQSIKQSIKDNGGKFQSSVSSKTDILVSGINSGSKLRKAQELEIKILTEKEFIRMLEDNNG